jgi:ATP-binding protein involved in chromosome partitioning
VPLLGQIPLDLVLREGGDVGRPVVLDDAGAGSTAAAFADIAETLAARSRGLAGVQLGLTPVGR